MNDSCRTCAFNTPGTAGAASEVKNRLRGMLCAHGLTPFFCHHAKDGTEYDWKHDPLGPMSLPANQRKVCGGWQRMVAKLKASGKFDIGDTPGDKVLLRRYQKSLASEATRTLDEFVKAKQDTPEKRQLSRKLEDLCRAVFGKP